MYVVLKWEELQIIAVIASFYGNYKIWSTLRYMVFSGLIVHLLLISLHIQIVLNL
jgi:hypothetical protein